MITRAALESAKASGSLFPFSPPIGWTATPRAFLMTKQLTSQLANARSSPDQTIVERWERLRADIAHFVENGMINWSFMKWLEPKKQEIWALRSVRPRPSIRVFGRFAEPNVFVGTHAAERTTLGGKWSLEWEMEKFICEEQWTLALGDSDPFRSPNYNDYVTENASSEPEVPP
jgi:hypothetical protein